MLISYTLGITDVNGIFNRRLILKRSHLLYLCSYESGVLENPATPAPKGLYKMTVDPINSHLDAEEIEINFAEGYPINVKSLKDRKVFDTPLMIIDYLNKIGGAHGIGRIDIVENRYIGLKVHL